MRHLKTAHHKTFVVDFRMIYRAITLSSALFILMQVSSCSDASQLNLKTGGRMDTQHSLAGDYLSARHAASSQQEKEAIRLFEQALAKSDKDPTLARRSLEMMVITGNIESAATLADTYAPYDSEASVVDMIQLADAVKKGNMRHFRSLVSALDQESVQSEFIVEKVVMPMLHAWAEFGNGNKDVALQKMEAIPDDNIELFVLSQKAMLYDATGEVDKAKAAYQDLFDQHPKQSLRTVSIAHRFFVRHGFTEDATPLMKQIQNLYPDSFTGSDESKKFQDVAPLTVAEAVSEIYAEMGGLFFVRQQFDSAIAYYRLAAHMEGSSPSTRVLIAKTLEQVQFYDSANQLYLTIPETSLYYLPSQISIARNLEQEEKHTEAITHLRSALAKFPENSQLQLSLADTYLNSKAYDLAIPVYDDVIRGLKQQTRNHWGIFYARGIAHERLQRWKEAEANFQQALVLEPDQPDVLNYLAYSWLEQNLNLEEAHDLLAKALAQRPDDAHIIDSYGWALYKLGRYAEAVEHLERANLMMPYDPVVNDHLGDAYWKAGRRKEAAFQWQRALTFDPDPAQMVLIEKKIKEGLPTSSLDATPSGISAS